ncbi:hypothetical protein [Pseudomonas sp. NPDC088444]|uniref:hypothetical protein n=1 Tax=Pseudomonas sp. NPDC088444 TaxID=3364456 RepID=UPI00384CA7A9
MKQEIGQIVVNHAHCDQPLLDLFVALSGVTSGTANILVQSLNLKAGSMTKAILDMAKMRGTGLHPDILGRLTTAISDYRKLSLLRNEVAHWQWSPSPDGTQAAEVSNIMRRDADGSVVSKEFTLHQLKQLSVGLIATFSALDLCARLTPYSDFPEQAMKQVFANLDNVSTKVKDALLALPEPSAEELP